MYAHAIYPTSEPYLSSLPSTVLHVGPYFCVMLWYVEPYIILYT